VEINKIYNEDCLETMSSMPDNFIDLVVTSPPYDNLRDYNGYSFEFEKIAKELFRVIKNGGVLVWVISDATIDGSETCTSFKQAIFFKECGFNLHETYNLCIQNSNYDLLPLNMRLDAKNIANDLSKIYSDIISKCNKPFVSSLIFSI
jgi:DNA modification methylase